MEREGERSPCSSRSCGPRGSPGVLAVWLAVIAFAVVLYRARRWSWGLAAANVALEAAFAVPVVALLLGDRLLDDEFVAALVQGGWQDAQRHLTLTAAAAVAITVWGSLDGLAKARGEPQRRTAAP